MNPEYDPTVWQSMDLEIKPDGHVAGQALSEPLPSGHVVTASVVSYEYERNGMARINHVPQVALTDETGAIVGEPMAHDARNAETAVENALQAGEYAAENPEQFLD